jgi:hypothetical protein
MPNPFCALKRLARFGLLLLAASALALAAPGGARAQVDSGGLGRDQAGARPEIRGGPPRADAQATVRPAVLAAAQPATAQPATLIAAQAVIGDTVIGELPFTFQYILNLTNIATDYDFDDNDNISYSYVFLLDLKRLAEQDFSSISDIVINTDKGNIIFNSTVNNAQVPRFIMGSVKTPDLVGEFIVTGATCNMDGKIYNLLPGINTVNQLPAFINKKVVIYPENKPCSYKKLDISTHEGIFAGITGEFFYVALIKINKEEQMYLYSPHLQYFMQDNNNIGRKIKFVITKAIDIESVEGNEEEEVCFESDKITDIFVLDR